MIISGTKGIKAIISNNNSKQLLKIVYLKDTQIELIEICKKEKIQYKIKNDLFFNTYYKNKQKYKYKHAIAIIHNKPNITLEKLLEKQKQKSILVMLDHLQDPFNFGAILRTCAAVGVGGVIIPNKNQAPSNHDAALKASQGYSLTIDIAVVPNLQQAIVDLKKANYWIYSTSIDKNAKPFRNVEYPNKCVLLLGSEGNGVSTILKKKSDYQIYVPMQPNIDSLNVAVAAGVILFEMIK